MKRECVIYQCLQSFSPVEQFPPDIAHDLLEGNLPIEIALCLDVLISREQYAFGRCKSEDSHFSLQIPRQSEQISENTTEFCSIGNN